MIIKGFGDPLTLDEYDELWPPESRPPPGWSGEPLESQARFHVGVNHVPGRRDFYQN